MTKPFKPSIQYFDVDDVVIKIVSDGKQSSGFVVLTGAPYPPAKALVRGRKISKTRAKQLLIQYWEKSNTGADKLLK